MITKTTKFVTEPKAWIVLPKDKGRKSIKNGKVYLKNGDNFEIELYNPLQECVLTDIKLNGKSISSSGLILRPGQRFYLDCFIEDRKKFVFNTYEVENSEETKEAIIKNGLLEVFFYKESVVNLNNWKSRFDKIIIEKWYPTYYPTYPWNYPNIYYGSSSTTLNSTSNNIYPPGATLTNCSTNTSSYNTNTNLFSSEVKSLNICSLSNNIETGRVEKGSQSSQKFVEVDMDFESNYISSTILQILPESVKPVETKDISKMTEESRLSLNFADLLSKLGELKNSGILTEEEFQNKKKEILAKI